MSTVSVRVRLHPQHTAMAVKRQHHTEHGSLPKRVKTETFGIGAAVTITHKVPRVKRIFAGQSGIVQASTGRIVDVTFTLQPKDAALYSDFLGADTTSCTAKFSTAHVDLYRERVLKLYSPFHTIVYCILLELFPNGEELVGESEL